MDRSDSSEKCLLIVIMCLMLSARDGVGKNLQREKHKCSISENYISPSNLCSASLKYDRGNFLLFLFSFLTDVIAPDSSSKSKPRRDNYIRLFGESNKDEMT